MAARVNVSVVFGIVLTPEECISHGITTGMLNDYVEYNIAFGDSASEEAWYVYCIGGYLPITEGHDIGGPTIHRMSQFPEVSPESLSGFREFCMNHGLGDRTPEWLVVASWV